MERTAVLGHLNALGQELQAEWNITERNGMKRNGTDCCTWPLQCTRPGTASGMERNGTEPNGTERNGMERNGLLYFATSMRSVRNYTRNGTEQNGPDLN